MLTFVVCMTCILLCLSSVVSLSCFFRLANTMSYNIFHFSSNLSLNNFTYTCHLRNFLMLPIHHCFFYCLRSWMLLFFRITLLAWLINGHFVQNMRFLLIHCFISFQQQSWLSMSLMKSPTLIKCFCDKSSFFVLQFEICCISILYTLQPFCVLGILGASQLWEFSQVADNSVNSNISQM